MQEYITEKYNGSEIRRKAEWHNCKKCNKSFLRRVAKKTKGTEYCSRDCFNESSRNRTEHCCSQCGKKFTRTKSQLTNSKHGFYFCSRICKDSAQSMDGKCSDIRPSHYGTGKSVYSDVAFRNLPNKCVDCGITEGYLLVVHHKDGDRKNPSLENLEIVCCNCHAKRHLRFEIDKWVFDSKSLTPRDKLYNIVMGK